MFGHRQMGVFAVRTLWLGSSSAAKQARINLVSRGNEEASRVQRRERTITAIVTNTNTT